MARVSVKAYFTYIHASAALAANRHVNFIAACWSRYALYRVLSN